jgi:hypothetical protein
MGLESHGGLNSFQQRRLLTTFQYIDKLLADIETALHSKNSRRPFFPYIADLAPPQRSAVEDFAARLRAKMLVSLADAGMQPDPPQIPVTRAIHAALTYIDISIQELRPRYMLGYGQVTDTAAEMLNRFVEELQPMVHAIDRIVSTAPPASKGRNRRPESGAHDEKEQHDET